MTNAAHAVPIIEMAIVNSVPHFWIRREPSVAPIAPATSSARPKIAMNPSLAPNSLTNRIGVTMMIEKIVGENLLTDLERHVSLAGFLVSDFR